MGKIEFLGHWGKNIGFTMSKKDLLVLRSLLISGQSTKPRKIGAYYFYFTGGTLHFNMSSNIETISRYSIEEDITSMLNKIDSLLANLK